LKDWADLEPSPAGYRIHGQMKTCSGGWNGNAGFGRDDLSGESDVEWYLAGIVFQHPSAESLLRELKRNGQLRLLCGFDKAPTLWAFSRFLGSFSEWRKK